METEPSAIVTTIQKQDFGCKAQSEKKQVPNSHNNHLKNKET